MSNDQNKGKVVEPIYSQDDIFLLYEKNKKRALEKLSELTVYSGVEPAIPGLNGWVYEQTIQFCLKRELKALGLRPAFDEQVSLGRRVRADLQVGDVAIEIKWFGLFSGADIAKYGKYKRMAADMGLNYLYLTGNEGYQSYKDGIISKVGQTNSFFLDTRGEWKRFVRRVYKLLQEYQRHNAR